MNIFSGRLDVKDVSAVLSDVNKISEKTGSVIVLFDALKTAGTEHIESAANHALRSFKNGKAVARTLPMEILVYASGQRQCSAASKFGLHKGENFVYVLILNGDEAAAQSEILKIIEKSDEISADAEVLKKEFCITDEELSVVGIDRIKEIVLERVALIDVWK